MAESEKPAIRDSTAPEVSVEQATRTRSSPQRSAWHGPTSDDFNYTKAGVMLTELQAPTLQQGELDLFGSEEPESAPVSTKDRTALMDAMDVLNRRFGRDACR